MNPSKSYAQASSTTGNTEKILKIKEMLPSLKAKNIKNIQKIIKGNSNSRPHINITMKGLSRKQVIISINNDNKKIFMGESSSYISNINRALKNIKLDAMVDFIQQDTASIIIITNKVTSTLDLQTIKKYVKNTNSINTNDIESPRLL